MVKKVVIPVAGFGTRMLPASKSIPKEMLPLADKPMIQFIFEECYQAGIEHLILVSHSSKSCLDDYFDRHFELEHLLEKAGKIEALEQLRSVSDSPVTVTMVRQKRPLGLGHAVLCAKELIANEPFAVVLPDVLLPTKGLKSSNNVLSEMIYRHQLSGANQVLVEPVESSKVSSYGIIGGKFLGDENSQSIDIDKIVEKPSVDEAPSNLAVVGRYVFNASIMEYLEKTPPGVGSEIQLTDAIKLQMHYEVVQGFKMIARSRDCGSKLGYFKAFVEQALSSSGSESSEFRHWLVDYVNQVVTKNMIPNKVKLVS